MPGLVDAAETTASLTVKDNRTGESYEIPIQHNAVNAIDFKKIKAPEDLENPGDHTEYGLRLLDPGFSNTAVMESAVTHVDGNKGTIQYRGHNIVDLIGKKQFADITFLLIWGHLPSDEEKAKFEKDIATVPLPDQSVFDVIKSFPPTSPPITVITAGLAALVGSEPENVPSYVAKNLYQGQMRTVDKTIIRVISQYPVVIAAAYCHANGRAFTPPEADGSFVENLLLMMGHVDAETGRPNPLHVDCLERLWVLTADHEMTNSTAGFLHTASSLADPISCMIASLQSGWGILHGGAIEVAYKHLQSIESVENVPQVIEIVKSGKVRLFGYGHRIYKVVDPRSVFIREILSELGESAKDDDVLAIAFEIDRIANSDEYFTKRGLKANADLFASFVYKAIGFPPDFILPLSCCSRVQGLMGHWREAMNSPPRIWRPQQVYTGDLDKPAPPSEEDEEAFALPVEVEIPDAREGRRGSINFLAIPVSSQSGESHDKE